MIAATESIAKDLVLERIEAGTARRPTDLLVLLDAELLSYSDIQEAVADLLYEGRIVLTSHRELRVGTQGFTGDRKLDGSSRKI
jgi:hypothetical protein